MIDVRPVAVGRAKDAFGKTQSAHPDHDWLLENGWKRKAGSEYKPVWVHPRYPGKEFSTSMACSMQEAWFKDGGAAKDMRTKPSWITNACPYCDSNHDPSIQCRLKPVSVRGQLGQHSVAGKKKPELVHKDGKLVGVRDASEKLETAQEWEKEFFSQLKEGRKKANKYGNLGKKDADELRARLKSTLQQYSGAYLAVEPGPERKSLPSPVALRHYIDSL